MLFRSVLVADGEQIVRLIRVFGSAVEHANGSSSALAQQRAGARRRSLDRSSDRDRWNRRTSAPTVDGRDGVQRGGPRSVAARAAQPPELQLRSSRMRQQTAPRDRAGWGVSPGHKESRFLACQDQVGLRTASVDLDLVTTGGPGGVSIRVDLRIGGCRATSIRYCSFGQQTPRA